MTGQTESPSVMNREVSEAETEYFPQQGVSAEEGILENILRCKIEKRTRHSGGERGLVMAAGILLFYFFVVRKFYAGDFSEESSFPSMGV